jgi:hypothetical protein
MKTCQAFSFKNRLKKIVTTHLDLVFMFLAISHFTFPLDHRQPNVMVACAQAHVAQAMDCIVVLFPKVGKCNQTNDTYTFKQSKILQISLQLR